MKKEGRKKQPTPQSAKVVKAAVESPVLQGARDAKMLFTFEEADSDKWSLSNIQQAHAGRLFNRLKYFSSQTVRQARESRNLATVDVAGFKNKQAKSRLQDKYEGLDGLTELIIQPSESMRLHGRLEANVFSVIWWDPEHQVHPDGRKNVR